MDPNDGDDDYFEDKMISLKISFSARQLIIFPLLWIQISLLCFIMLYFSH